MATPRNAEKPRPASPSGFGNLNVPGTRAGGAVSIGLAVLAWLTIPVARPFLLGTAVVGGMLGIILWWKHSKI